MLRADDQLGMAGEDHRQRVGAFQPAEGSAGGGNRIHAALEVQVHQLCHGFGIGFGGEFLPFGLQLRAQFRVVLNDAVMHNRHARRAMRMRIAFGGRAMRRPARVPDPRGAR